MQLVLEISCLVFTPVQLLLVKHALFDSNKVKPNVPFTLAIDQFGDDAVRKEWSIKVQLPPFSKRGGNRRILRIGRRLAAC